MTTVFPTPVGRIRVSRPLITCSTSVTRGAPLLCDQRLRHGLFDVQPIPADVESSTEFLIRRFLRIYPIYWLYALFYLARKMFDTATVPTADVLKSLLLLPGNSALLIPQGWTLSYEVYFYLCFAVIIALGMNRGLTLLAIAFLAMICLRKVLPVANPIIDLMSNSLLLEFVAGSALAAAMLSGVRLSSLVCNVIIAASIVGWGTCFGTLSVGVGFPTASSSADWFSGKLEHGPPNYIRRLPFLGDSSYSFYLLHVILLGGLFDASSLGLPSLSLHG